MEKAVRKAKKRFWITLFLGMFGVHKFMDGKIGWGFAYMCTGGLLFVGWIRDAIQARATWALLIKTKMSAAESVSVTVFALTYFFAIGYAVSGKEGTGVAFFIAFIIACMSLAAIIKMVRTESKAVPHVPQEEPSKMQQSNNQDYDSMDGHQFEYFCADVLKKNGFTDVEVTQGSGDYGVDVLAKKDGITYAIQCKCYSHTVGNKAVQEAFSGKEYYKCMVGVVLTNNYFTKAAKETAMSNRIILWDRDKLNDMISNIKNTEAEQCL